MDIQKNRIDAKDFQVKWYEMMSLLDPFYFCSLLL